ncbi:hyaluronan and proteoglycan link protein 2-like [Myxocyprinus asiaticus]|uniref:hyaluronan and proteoglycan link protein 2-like n=1 Tax=Myxocyprinus asiaticus TaxID=70543 RepID=UPI002222D85C|nr:hyaluronan and proteoglycan link protein 2-like [Myxocyprinus asiaticus]
MNCIALLVVTFCCVSWTSAKYHHHDQEKDKELKYLLEPLVYAEVTARRGQAVILPCMMRFKLPHYRVKWTKIEPLSRGVENIVLITNGHADKQYGSIGPRASLQRAHDLDVSLRLTDLELEDDGSYRCELIDGIEDEIVILTLRIEGVVFPYQSYHSRYRFTYFDAKEACAEQDAVLATYKQLYRAWTEGLDWCNAGWLNDGTVSYPILHPRQACGGDLLPGIRSYGPRHRIREQYDAFCFTSTTKGSVFYIPGPLNFVEAEHACRHEGADLARVGQVYSSWKFLGLDHCDGGWLLDGSVRFPIINPREHCGGITEQGVRSFGYPSKSLRLYGAYCYR